MPQYQRICTDSCKEIRAHVRIVQQKCDPVIVWRNAEHTDPYDRRVSLIGRLGQKGIPSGHLVLPVPLRARIPHVVSRLRLLLRLLVYPMSEGPRASHLPLLCSVGRRVPILHPLARLLPEREPVDVLVGIRIQPVSERVVRSIVVPPRGPLSPEQKMILRVEPSISSILDQKGHLLHLLPPRGPETLGQLLPPAVEHPNRMRRDLRKHHTRGLQLLSHHPVHPIDLDRKFEPASRCERAVPGRTLPSPRFGSAPDSGLLVVQYRVRVQLLTPVVRSHCPFLYGRTQTLASPVLGPHPLSPTSDKTHLRDDPAVDQGLLPHGIVSHRAESHHHHPLIAEEPLPSDAHDLLGHERVPGVGALVPHELLPGPPILLPHDVRHGCDVGDGPPVVRCLDHVHQNLCLRRNAHEHRSDRQHRLSGSAHVLTARDLQDLSGLLSPSDLPSGRLLRLVHETHPRCIRTDDTHLPLRRPHTHRQQNKNPHPTSDKPSPSSHSLIP